MKENYYIKMVMNNNVVFVKNILTNTESVLIGKGIGFGKKKDSKVYFSKEIIDKSFVNFSESIKSEYHKLITQMDVTIMGLCEEIIHFAEEELGKLNDNIHIVLTDHIGFAIDRVKDNIVISNPFLYEIKHLYTKEYEIAKKAINKINKEQKIKLPDDEAGFIALHLHSARKNIKVKETLKNTRIIKEIVELIEKEIGYKLTDMGLNYRRLLTHIRAFIDRVENNKSISNPLLTSIKSEFKESWKAAEEVKKIIDYNLKLDVSEDELSYLTIHIDRLKRM